MEKFIEVIRQGSDAYLKLPYATRAIIILTALFVNIGVTLAFLEIYALIRKK